MFHIAKVSQMKAQAQARDLRRNEGKLLAWEAR